MVSVLITQQRMAFRPSASVTIGGQVYLYDEPSQLLCALLDGSAPVPFDAEIQMVFVDIHGVPDPGMPCTVAALAGFLLDLHMSFLAAHDLQRRVDPVSHKVSYALDGGRAMTAPDLLLALKYQDLLDCPFLIRFFVGGEPDRECVGNYMSATELVSSMLSDNGVLDACRVAGFVISEDNGQVEVLFPSVN